MLKLSYNGSTEAAMAAFSPFYEIAKTNPPSINESNLLPADEINESKDTLCSEGGSLPHANRPVHSASLEAVDPIILGQLYERWEQFTTDKPEAKETVVRVNFYDYRHVKNVNAADTAFAWRKNPINVLQVSLYGP